MSTQKSFQIAVINGPNINILGLREPEVYGKVTLTQIEENLNKLGTELNLTLHFFQSNHEGYIVDFIQDHLNMLDGVVINPAGYTKNGYAILDALTAISTPFVEVHLTNIFERGEWHSESIFSSKAIGFISGFKDYVYTMGVYAINHYLISKQNHQ
jgi:3-dehydroquinate dehydratase-2